jgi:hypothetical protein
MEMKPTKDLLIAARAKIAKPEHWTRQSMMRDAQGVSTYDPKKAHCYCLVGSMAAANNEDPLAYDPQGAIKALNKALRASPFRFNMLSAFNDHPDTTHADVLAVIDAAIAIA